MRKGIGKKGQDKFGRHGRDQAGEKESWCAIIGEWVGT